MTFDVIGDILAQCARRGVQLAADAGQLRVRARKGAVTPELEEALARHKQTILAAVRRANSSATVERPRSVPRAPLSFEQERYYLLQSFSPESRAFNLYGRIDVRGAVDHGALAEALVRLVARHEALRSRFVATEDGVVQELDDGWSGKLLCDLDGAGPLRARIDELVRSPYDLARGPLFRAGLFSDGGGDQALILAGHHLIWDAVSVGLVTRDLASIYRAVVAGRTAPLSQIAVQQSGYAAWQREAWTGSELEAAVDYWGTQIARAPARPRLPARISRRRAGQPIAAEPLDLGGELCARVGAAVAKSGQPWTAYVFHLACFVLLLRWRCRQRAFNVTLTLSNRYDDGIADTVGNFFSFLPVPFEVRDDETFAQLVDRIREQLASVYEHQTIPWRSLFESGRLAASEVPGASGGPVIFTYLPDSSKADDGRPVFSLTEVGFAEAGFEVHLGLVERGGGVQLGALYNADLFSDEQVRELLSQQRLVVDVASADIDASVATIGARLADPWRDLRVMASFSAEPLQAPLEVLIDELAVPWKLHLCPHGQVFQPLLDSADGGWSMDAILLRLEDWAPPTAAGSRDLDELEGNVDELLQVLDPPAQQARPTLVVLCPPSPAVRADPELSAEIAALEERIAGASAPGLRVIWSRELVASVGEEAVDDVHADAIAGIPYRDSLYAACALRIARDFHRLVRGPIKVLAVDCDNTLWKGIVGEDGVAGIEVDTGRLALQRRLVQLQQRGVLVCLVSRNRDADVWAVFEERDGMLLRREHVAATRIGWGSKVESLQSLAGELNVGLDAFVFIDDSARECAEVRERLPEVLTVQVPVGSGDLATFVDGLWCLDVPVDGGVGAARTAHYQANAEREAERRGSRTLAEFLARLELEVEIHPARESELARIAELTQRTNQFNATTVRRSEEDVRALLAVEGKQLLSAHVRDRFGDYGLVGVMELSVRDSAVSVDAFMLSCRALGRRVEHRMLSHVLDLALAAGREWVDVEVVETERNVPVREFLLSVGRECERSRSAGRIGYRFPATAGDEIARGGELVGVDDRSASTAPSTQPSSSLTSAEASVDPGLVWSTGRDVIAAMSSLPRGVAVRERPPSVAPRDDTEAALVGIMEGLLRIDSIGVDDDFFALGGDSLAAVRLVGEVRKQFEVELSAFALPRPATVARFAMLIRGGATTDEPASPPWRADEALAASLPRVATSANVRWPPRRILLTGATGYLGRYLLRDFLTQSDAELHCLVRAGDADSALARLRASQEQIGGAEAMAWARVHAVCGDLSDPGLGVSEVEWRRLARDMDAVVHSAARVSFLLPYQALRTANVLATEQLLRLAAHETPKAFHLVSTMGFFTPATATGTIRESSFPDEPVGISGYAQTKWMADALAQRASEAGLAVSIHRPSLISGDSRTGRGAEDELFNRFLRGCVLARSTPDLAPEAVIAACPVDWVSRGIVALALGEGAVGGIYHHLPRVLLRWRDMSRWLMELGAMHSLPLGDWIALIRDQGDANPLGSFADVLPELDEWAGMELNTDDTTRALAVAGVDYPGVDRSLLARYVEALSAGCDSAEHRDR